MKKLLWRIGRLFVILTFPVWIIPILVFALVYVSLRDLWEETKQPFFK
jgi:hypothetical protein